MSGAACEASPPSSTAKAGIHFDLARVDNCEGEMDSAFRRNDEQVGLPSGVIRTEWLRSG
jgi:hypothetical protein